MNDVAITKPTRRPRFRRAGTAPAFRVTDNDVAIVREIGRHRFVRSTHIASIVDRSVDRTNDRLLLLFHAGYVDRPRAQLDYYPTSGSAPMVYALTEPGARLLSERLGMDCANVEWSRRNREAGRPFIEHQLEIVDFYVALRRDVRCRNDIRLLDSEQLIAAFPEQTRNMRNPLALRVSLSHNGNVQEIGLIPDMIFGLLFSDGSRRCFMVEIDRGTMPVSRADITQTSFERKMRAYLAAHATGQHEERFGWKNFRILTVTTDRHRMRSMMESLQKQHILQSPGAALFFFAVRDELRTSDPLTHPWQDGNGREVRLL
jgi:hypothetical protein